MKTATCLSPGFAYCIAAIAASLAPVVSASAEPATDGVATYRDTLKPLLAERCFSCHGALKQEAGLRLDTVAAMEKGGDSGPAITKQNTAESLLLQRVSDPDPATRMPPDGEGEALNAAQLGTLQTWIAAGTPGPADEQPEADPRQHWAFQPRIRPDVPAKPASGWGRNPIDAFVAQQHAEHGVTPQPEAPRHVLIRRLYLDLIGLPPTYEELAALEADASPDWYEKLVDRLLADPRHGERWARHWMDVWRYSDWWGLGSDHRNSQKHMWHWRDWIIDSVNADVPYAEMLRQMLAADELYPDEPQKLRATGYLGRNWFKYQRTQWLDETVEHVGKGMLGLTLNCAKCHDHKYDPLPQEEFYRMRAFFEPYHMRLDMVAGETNYEKNGVPRAFDTLLDAPTYLFIRGDEKKPDTTRPLTPGVPAVVAFKELDIQPVSLPKVAWQPVRRPGVIEALIANAEQGVKTAETAVATAVAKRQAAEASLATIKNPSTKPTAGSEPPAVVAQAASPASPDALVEDFKELLPARWTPAGGDWQHEPGVVVQTEDGDVWAGLRLSPSVPIDFDATTQFTIRGGKAHRSVGLAFDSVGAIDPAVPGSPTDGAVLVYMSGNAQTPKVQCAFRQGGGWQYPANGAAALPIASDKKYSLRVAARGPLVNVWVDGRLVLAWRIPIARRPGALQLVTYDAITAFHRLEVGPLPADLKLQDLAAAAAAPVAATPALPTQEAAEAAVATASAEVAAAEQGVAVAKAARDSVERRAEAMRAAWALEESSSDAAVAAKARELAQAAARAEKLVAVEQARQKVAQAEGKLAQTAADKKEPVEKELSAARAALAQAEQSLANPGDSFTPLAGGAKWSATTFKVADSPDPEPPARPTSSGRRKALADWITDPRNPLTARVAANHIWVRHMGRPLVSTVFDFGRKGTPPDSPGLLDWLASELVDGPSGGPQWSMKHLHKLIVTSAAYRMGSSAAGAAANEKTDPDNRWLWRRDQIRLESQVVRDCVLALAGTLDPTVGGPSVPAAQQAASLRRSIYFFHSSVDRNPFLTTFDEADVQDCYRRDQSIVPQQALALSNAALIHDAAEKIAVRLTTRPGSPPATAAALPNDAALVTAAFETVLGRVPSPAESEACLESLAVWRKPANAKPGAPGDPGPRLLVWTLLNHNDFVTLR
ncbi:MAG: DUF1553 domain-containing protein [Pirellulales bacterium]